MFHGSFLEFPKDSLRWAEGKLLGTLPKELHDFVIFLLEISRLIGFLAVDEVGVSVIAVVGFDKLKCFFEGLGGSYPNISIMHGLKNVVGRVHNFLPLP